ncbi:MAG: hypothetical protein C0498_01440 [Anaerolinea sp.]|nr:hypothetical protein [Anaerolinea sp.]
MSPRRAARRAAPIITRDHTRYGGLFGWDGDIAVRGAAFTGPLPKPSVAHLRRWSRRNPWVRAAIDLRRSQVGRGRWDIVPVESGVDVPEGAIAAAKALLRNPNPKGESFRTLIEQVVEDLLVLDQGCIEKELTVGGRLRVGGVQPIAYLWGVDGGTIRFDPEWDGSDTSAPRYYQFDLQGREVQRFRNDELVCMMERPVTYSPLGLSALEVLADTIEGDLAAAEYNRRAVRQATPPGLLDLGEGIRPDAVDSFRAYWDAEIAGRSQIAIIGGGKGAKWTQLSQSNSDMQYMEWLTYLARKICAVFHVQPQDIGIAFDVNRSQGQVNAEFTEEHGYAPLMELVAEYLTREVVASFHPLLTFRFSDLGRHSNQAAAEYYSKALGGLSWVRPNDALAERGDPPLDRYGDELWVPVPKAGPVPMSLYLAGLEAPPPAPVASGPPAPDEEAAATEAGAEDQAVATEAGKATRPFDLAAFYRRR